MKHTSVQRPVSPALVQSLLQLTVQILCLYVLGGFSVYLASKVKRFFSFLRSYKNFDHQVCALMRCTLDLLKIYSINFG